MGEKKRSPGELNRFIADAMEFELIGKHEETEEETEKQDNEE